MKRETQALTKRGRPAISDDKRRQMRKKIAVATNALFKEQGYRQISMRRIAQEVGCSPMTLYKYYDAKIDILYTLWAGVFELVFNGVDDICLEHQSPRQQLILLSSAYVGYWLEHTENYRLVFMTEGIEQSDVGLFIRNPDIGARFEIFAIAIAKATSDALSDHELAKKGDALICFLHGIAHNVITISGHSWPSTDYLIEMAVRGIIDA